MTKDITVHPTNDEARVELIPGRGWEFKARGGWVTIKNVYPDCVTYEMHTGYLKARTIDEFLMEYTPTYPVVYKNDRTSGPDGTESGTSPQPGISGHLYAVSLDQTVDYGPQTER